MNEEDVYLVSEEYGEWVPVAIYEALADAKNLAPESDDWQEDRGVIRNHGPGRDLFIQPIKLIAPRSAVVRPTRDQLARQVALAVAFDARFGDWPVPDVRDLTYEIADALLLAEFWPGVSVEAPKE